MIPSLLVLADKLTKSTGWCQSGGRIRFLESFTPRSSTPCQAGALQKAPASRLMLLAGFSLLVPSCQRRAAAIAFPVVNCAYGYQTKETSEDEEESNDQKEGFQKGSHTKEIFFQEKSEKSHPEKGRDKRQDQG
jgi:hypothetical protein